MKKEDLKNKNEAELKIALSDAREEMSAIRFGKAGSKSKNVKEALAIRRKIARILTALGAMKKSSK